MAFRVSRRIGRRVAPTGSRLTFSLCVRPFASAAGSTGRTALPWRTGPMARAADKRRQLLRVATIFFALGGHATAGERDQRAVRAAPTPQTINQIVKLPATAGSKREAKPGHHRPADRRKRARKLRDAPHAERAAVGMAKSDGVDTESIFG